MKGSGRPVTGNNPMVIPMFTNTWKATIAAIPAATNCPNRSRAADAIREQPQDEQRIQPNDCRRTKEAELLGHGGEDEVGCLGWDKCQVRLGSLEQPLTEHTAAPRWRFGSGSGCS